jgi:ankyrin repeat protein
LWNYPLHEAACRGKSFAVRLLLDQGAKATITDQNNKTPYDVAANEEVREVFESTFPGNEEVQKTFERKLLGNDKITN